jgi:hypothetical protein
MPLSELATIKAGLDLAKALKDWVPLKRGDAELRDEICLALRALYFTPSGVLDLLKKIDSGEKVSDEELTAALVKFNDREPRVQRSSHLLSFDRLQQELGLNLATIEVVHQVRVGKMSLRKDIQNEINYYGQRGVKADKQKIKALLANIDELNALVVEIEAVVNSRAKTPK